MEWINGGVCAPLGFRAAGVHCGIRAGKAKKDLALVVSDVMASAAAVYTQNLVQGAPIGVTRNNLQNGQARAVICNSGIANTCNADGLEKAMGMCILAADALSIAPEDVIVASTGVIGQPLDFEPIRRGIPELVQALSTQGNTDAVQAMMTTDTVPKEFAVCVELDGGPVKIGGMAKGSGMINPNMATMLAFITTDAAISPSSLAAMLKEAADLSFNRVSVDGDTSTNDMLCVLANGQSGVAVDVDCAPFVQGLQAVCIALAKLLAQDGEGATKLIECRVSGAPTTQGARVVADSIINSPLVKTAMFGGDANWGRILCAIGYAGIALDVGLIDVAFSSAQGQVWVCKRGAGIDFSEPQAAAVLACDALVIDVRLNQGPAQATAWGCDLSYDYVKINGDYRT